VGPFHDDTVWLTLQPSLASCSMTEADLSSSHWLIILPETHFNTVLFLYYASKKHVNYLSLVLPKQIYRLTVAYGISNRSNLYELFSNQRHGIHNVMKRKDEWKTKEETRGRKRREKERNTSWPESAIELYLPNDRCLSAKLVPTFADRGRHVISVTVTDPYCRILGFLDRSRYFFAK
jgi:hypothetical protein